MDAIRVAGLGRCFGGTVALDNLSLTVRQGEIFALVGPDGAGKTTVMRMLAGILLPSSGDAWVAGFHTVREADALKDHIGYMAQRFGLYADLTVQENLDFYADLYSVPRKVREPKMAQLLAFSNLGPFRRRRAGNLSGGMKQKLGLACALIHTPQVLFLDEPTNGVDPVSRRDFWRILYPLQQEGMTIFVATAYLDEAERCDRVALLHQGQLLKLDTVDGLKGLLQGTLLELRSSQPRAASACLRAAGMGSVALFGDRVHILAPDAEKGRAAIARALADSGVDLWSLSVIEPSLEDVFIAAIPKEAS